MSYSQKNRRQSLITASRITTLVLLVVLVAMGGVILSLLNRPAQAFPSAAKIASAVNGPAEFQRPSAMKYVPATGSCVVGGTVTSTTWHSVQGTTAKVGDLKENNVEYTSFEFVSDQGRTFTVSDGGALWTSPGANLGLQVACDPNTMNTADSYGLVSIIYGGK